MLADTYTRGDADHILVTTGAIEANFLLFNVLLDAGDHVIAPYPAYQQLYSVPRAIGCDVSLWKVGPETGYRYDVDALEKLVTPRTKVIVVNTPAQSDGRDAGAGGREARVRAGGISRRHGDWRRSVPMARGAGRRAVCAAVLRFRRARRSAWARCRNRSGCRGCASAGLPGRRTSFSSAGAFATTSRSAPAS